MGDRPRALDLFCGAGGMAMGLHRAGFEVVGVDIAPQPNYPFEFHRADALAMCRDRLRGCWHESYHRSALPGMLHACLGQFDVIHASAPCQAFSNLAALHRGAAYDARHPNLIAPTRELLEASGLPWVMENVPRAPLRRDLLLCGSMFDLPVRRHRVFESNVALTQPDCRHERWAELWPDGFPRDVSKARVAAGHRVWSPVVSVNGHGGGPGKVLETWKWAMGVPTWAGTKRELSQAIPPAYGEYVGRQLIAHLAS